jgi:hypothetical protein
MASLHSDDFQSDGFEVTINRQRTRTGAQPPVTNFTADLKMFTHDGKLWSFQDLNLMSYEVLHGLYRTAGQLPHKIHTAFVIYVEDYNTSKDDANFMVNLWIDLVKHFKNTHNSNERVHLWDTVLDTTTVTAARSRAKEHFQQFSIEDTMTMTTVLEYILETATNYKLALEAKDDKIIDSIYDTLFRIATDIIQLFKIFDRMVHEPLRRYTRAHLSHQDE